MSRSQHANAGAYPIGAVSRTVGIEVETLRMWERRHGLGPSSRTEGGHRLYSEEDVEVLRAVKTLLDAGMRIGAVATLPHQRILEEAARLPGKPPQAAPAPLDMQRLIDEVLDAALRLDLARATEQLDRPRQMLSGATIARAFYVPLMHQVGERWADGALPVGVEHFVEKLVTTRLLSIFQDLPDGRGKRVVCACPPHERHEGGLIAAAIELRSAGFSVTLLGADLPVAELERAAMTTRAEVVVLAATIDPEPHTRRALEAAAARAPLSKLPLVLGGRAAQKLAPALGKRATVAPSIADVVDLARSGSRI